MSNNKGHIRKNDGGGDAMEYEKYKSNSEAALGRVKAPLVFKNAGVLNVFTEEILVGDVAVAEGMIVGVGKYEGQLEIDCSGKYICPGFIDSHLHLESTLVTPGELIEQALKWGTTTFIVDPHESANVCGYQGVEYILDQTQDVDANVYVMAPSCVPATKIDDNGYAMGAEVLKQCLRHPRILGLGEVMDYEAVIEGDEGIHEKLRLFEGRIIDGHAPFLSDNHLTAYVLAGISTDHECCDYDYAMKERRNGMTVLIREGSAARNLDDIVSGLVHHTTDTSGFCFCTDDKHIEDIRKVGHISYNVKRAIELGLPPIKAFKMATYNAARAYDLKHLGGIGPGYQADLIILTNLEEVQVEAVYFKGRLIPEIRPEKKTRPCPENLRNTVHLDGFDVKSLEMPIVGYESDVIGMVEGQIITRHLKAKLPGCGCFIPDGQYKKIAVIERHKGTGKIGLAAVAGFGITNGAIASSVSHDSHNLIVIGDNDDDMALAIDEIIRTQGGYVLVEDGHIVGSLPLPIMGLMSDAGHDLVDQTLHRMIQKAHEMGIPPKMEPFISLSFMALPVIPEIRVTARGIYDVIQRRLI